LTTLFVRLGPHQKCQLHLAKLIERPPSNKKEYQKIVTVVPKAEHAEGKKERVTCNRSHRFHASIHLSLPRHVRA